MLESEHVLRQFAGDADDPLAIQRNYEVKLVSGKRPAADAQESPRQRLPRSGRFQHGEQCDAQRASPGKQPRF
jgi:hypothetical protein